MAHLIETIRNKDISEALNELKGAHTYIATHVISSLKDLPSETDYWGMAAKRLYVDFDNGAPVLVGKQQEKFSEIINILATTERTIETLSWLASEYPGMVVRECHPSTSDDAAGNDIVLVDNRDSVVVRCEVCDVVATNAAQNGKEKKDIKNLGCTDGVPADGVDRYIATSKEFSEALTSKKRKWKNICYRYQSITTDLPGNTVMLKVIGHS